MIIGREEEINFIQSQMRQNLAQLGIVYGRRRVGKSALLKYLLGPKDFYFEAIKKYPQKKQIEHFLKQLAMQSKSRPFTAKNWEEAFDIFSESIKKGEIYVVFDEFPWMASEDAELVAILKYYWDRHWKNNSKLTLVLCGSVANYMVKHLIHSEALHNRKTFELKLEALKANEAQKFFKDKRSKAEILQYLMTFGGIPKYLEQIDINKSYAININHLCLMKNSFFKNEFETIFKEQFKISRVYEQIVEALSAGACTKQSLSKKLNQHNSGGFKTYLENLERADFIRSFSTFSPNNSGTQKLSKTKKYYLWDEWIKFYFTFIKPSQKVIDLNGHKFIFSSLVEKKIDSYFGYCFERFCIKNIDILLDKLGIPLEDLIDYGPYFRQAPRSIGASSLKKGFQIDLLIVRKRKIITLVECKYRNEKIGLSIIQEIRAKEKILKIKRSEYTVEKVLICANGVTQELEEAEFFHQIILAEDFF